MRRGAKSALIGKWRIIEMALWDSDYLDMVEPAYIQFQANGLGEFKFGCVVGGLDCTLFADAADEHEWQVWEKVKLPDDAVNVRVPVRLKDTNTLLYDVALPPLPLTDATARDPIWRCDRPCRGVFPA